ncbi:Potassium voltage-gated channel subfamily H member 1 (Ether-a-go-go potassium channel 1) (EAG channel 1) (EAG1) (r-eag) (Voltage-gated potassium channel subunit Kv10.1) [Durusdinium trenchii]|uniref:Potassium voltage-gated channel subfamily H member 1 (Ether-a-go-go potassium channel 1) (EAG channel 1) (EAG1) (R-eag) (Voltage-gated potassium channel subunit Kv10.1) n=1 Tax=Durusdinium trenchii TaxID=1381693 RepID=A0ABP0K4U1_9DINO
MYAKRHRETVAGPAAAGRSSKMQAVARSGKGFGVARAGSLTAIAGGNGGRENGWRGKAARKQAAAVHPEGRTLLGEAGTSDTKNDLDDAGAAKHIGMPSKISEAKRREIERDLARIRKRVDEIYKNVDYRLNPATPVHQYWNAVMLSVLLYSASWTPFEVAFVTVDSFSTGFAVNRLIDAILLLDFVGGFFRSYKDPISGRVVRDTKTIITAYLRGRMIVDFVTVFGCLICDTLATYSFVNDWHVVSNTNMLELTRLLRLSHLPKLPELFRAVGKYFHIMDSNTWSYSKLSLFKFLVTILTLVHWMACLWRVSIKVQLHSESFGNTWIMTENLMFVSVQELYVVCVYWACTTITTIGYGDVANPGTELERTIAVFAMLTGALVWARIIAGITSIVSSFNLQELEFSEQMDRLNAYMEAKHMPLELRERLRQYFRHRRSMELDYGYASLLEKMSPTLRGEVARSVSKEWLERVPWLNNGSIGFIASIAVALEHELYAPQELIIGNELRVLTRGVVAKNSRIYTRGSVWGIDMIVRSPRLKNLGPGRALTYAQVLCLNEDALEELLQVYPDERARIRASAIWIALRRSFVKYAVQMKLGQKIIHAMASEASKAGLDMAEVFSRHDTRGRDELSKKEFHRALTELGYQGPKVLLNVILSRFDKDGDGAVDYKEFVTYFMRDYTKDKVELAQDKYEYQRYINSERVKETKARQEQEFAEQQRQQRRVQALTSRSVQRQSSDNLIASVSRASEGIPTSPEPCTPSGTGAFKSMKARPEMRRQWGEARRSSCGLTEAPADSSLLSSDDSGSEDDESDSRVFRNDVVTVSATRRRTTASGAAASRAVARAMAAGGGPDAALDDLGGSNSFSSSNSSTKSRVRGNPTRQKSRSFVSEPKKQPSNSVLTALVEAEREEVLQLEENEADQAQVIEGILEEKLASFRQQLLEDVSTVLSNALMSVDDDVVLLAGPGALADAGAQVVAPPLAALLGDSALEGPFTVAFLWSSELCSTSTYMASDAELCRGSCCAFEELAGDSSDRHDLPSEPLRDLVLPAPDLTSVTAPTASQSAAVGDASANSNVRSRWCDALPDTLSDVGRVFFLRVILCSDLKRLSWCLPPSSSSSALLLPLCAALSIDRADTVAESESDPSSNMLCLPFTIGDIVADPAGCEDHSRLVPLLSRKAALDDGPVEPPPGYRTGVSGLLGYL